MKTRRLMINTMNAIDLDDFDRLARQEGRAPMDNREDLMLPPLDQVVQQPIPGGVTGPMPFQHFLQHVYTPPPLDRQQYTRSPSWPTVLGTPTPSPAPSGPFARGSTAFPFESIETTLLSLNDTPRRGGGGDNAPERGGPETPLRGELETPDPAGNNMQQGAKKRKGRNKAMTATQKVALARICVEHAGQYGVMKMKDFWDMVKKLLQEEVGYYLKSPRNTVIKWISERIDQIVDEEMGSGTEVDRDDFKAAVEAFAERVKAYNEEVEAKKKTAEELVQEAQETARVQTSMLHGLDDEDTPGIDTPAPESRTSTPSIALNKSSLRQRRSTSGAALLVHGMERSLGRLADAIQYGNKRKRSESPGEVEDHVAQRFSDMDKRMDRMEGGIAKILDKLDEM